MAWENVYYYMLEITFMYNREHKRHITVAHVEVKLEKG